MKNGQFAPWRRLLLALLACALAACTPLRQASMVYGSKSVAGFNVGVSASAQPDFNVTIGYRNNDFAYVPVAVAYELEQVIKACAEGAAGTRQSGLCTSAADKMMHVIAGQYVDSDSASEQSQAPKAINEFVDAARQVREAEGSLKTAADQEARASADLKLLQAIDSRLQVATTTASITETVAELAARGPEFARPLQDVLRPVVSQVNSATTTAVSTLLGPVRPIASQEARAAALHYTAAAQLVASTRATAAVRREALRLKTLALEEAAKANPRLFGANTNKSDALSVFGRFDGLGTASVSPGTTTTTPGTATFARPDVGFNFGKVFSTGVAAQHLTDAAARGAILQAHAHCLETAKALFETLTDKSMANLKVLLDRCDVKALSGRSNAN